VKRAGLYKLVNTERDNQDAKRGIQDHVLIDDKLKTQLKERLAILQKNNDLLEKIDKIAWFEIALEEFFEFFTAEDGSENQEEELVQIIAVLVEIYDYYIMKGNRKIVKYKKRNIIDKMTTIMIL
jgi:hypothetical protein